MSVLVRFSHQRAEQPCMCTTSGIHIRALLNIVLGEINNRSDVPSGMGCKINLSR